MIDIVVALAVAVGHSAASYRKAPSSVSEKHILPSPADVRSEMIACGFSKKTVSVQFERALDEDVVWINQADKSISTDMLNCAARVSLKTISYIYFRNDAEQKRYDPIYWKIADEAEVREARKWLSDRKLLASLPLPAKGKPLSAYAEAVEEFCGVKRRTLLSAIDEHTITFAKDGLGKLTAMGVEGAAVNEAQFMCVLNATSAADLESQNIFFGLIGNARPNEGETGDPSHRLNNRTVPQQ